jgi:hypothetical protein
MSLILPSASEKTMLEFALGVTVPGNQKLKLFVNNYVPDDTTVLANLTEMSTNGYADKTLTKTLWVVTAGGVGAAASGAYAQQTWTFTNAGGANTVYGYFITDVTSGLLLWVEAFTSAKVIQNNGDQILITPTITNSRT